MVNVEIVYVTADKAVNQLKCVLPESATVADALHYFGWFTRFPEIKDYPLGIFAKRAALTTVLREGDRIEIYRPLLLDPKEKRRQRVKKD